VVEISFAVILEFVFRVFVFFHVYWIVQSITSLSVICIINCIIWKVNPDLEVSSQLSNL